KLTARDAPATASRIQIQAGPNRSGHHGATFPSGWPPRRRTTGSHRNAPATRIAPTNDRRVAQRWPSNPNHGPVTSPPKTHRRFDATRAAAAAGMVLAGTPSMGLTVIAK